MNNKPTLIMAKINEVMLSDLTLLDANGFEAFVKGDTFVAWRH